MNTVAYVLYLLITYIITVHVGLAFYRNGFVFILRLLDGDIKMASFINRILLVGYYLLNLGYVAISIQSWQTIYSMTEVMATVCIMTGKILLILGIVHFMNMTAILIISRIHRTHSDTKS